LVSSLEPACCCLWQPHCVCLDRRRSVVESMCLLTKLIFDGEHDDSKAALAIARCCSHLPQGHPVFMFPRSLSSLPKSAGPSESHDLLHPSHAMRCLCAHSPYNCSQGGVISLLHSAGERFAVAFLPDTL
jgi:hypothetical protein